MNLAELRAELPVLERAAYLNTGTFGPLPRRAVEAVIGQERTELELGRVGKAYWELVRAHRERARAALAATIGAPPETVALTHSTTEGCNIAVASLRLEPGDEIVTTDVEHFGLLGPLHASGARVRVARLRGRPAGEAYEAVAAEVGAATRLLAVSHVAWSTGNVLPLARLAELARDAGAALLVDGAQSAGAIPVDVGACGADFYTISGQKWLLGPDGTGGLYVRPELTPVLAVPFVSYFGQQAYEPDGTFVPLEGAARFDPGTVPAPALAGLVESLAFAEAAGEERFARARDLAERCRERLAERFEVVTDPGQATLVTFAWPGDTAAAVTALADRGVIVRDIPGSGWLRVSIGFWTAEEELDRLLDGLADAA